MNQHLFRPEFIKELMQHGLLNQERAELVADRLLSRIDKKGYVIAQAEFLRDLNQAWNIHVGRHYGTITDYLYDSRGGKTLEDVIYRVYSDMEGACVLSLRKELQEWASKPVDPPKPNKKPIMENSNQFFGAGIKQKDI